MIFVEMRIKKFDLQQSVKLKKKIFQKISIVGIGISIDKEMDIGGIGLDFVSIAKSMS
jgi:hypothetical protein